MLTLLDHFVWNGAATSSFFTPWMSYPAHLKKAEIWIDTKLTDGNSNLSITLQTSIDQTSEEGVTTGLTNGATTGPAITQISQNLGPWVRLQLSTTTLQQNTMISVWLLPKQD